MYKKIDKATEYLKNIVKLTPYCVIICNNGLEGIETEMSISTSIPFSNIPYFVESSEEGIFSQLVYGILEDKYVLLVHGMPFMYEGISNEDYAFYFRVFANLGIKNVVFTSSCVSLKKSLKQGDFVSISDHLSINAPNLLVGENYNRFGPRIVDCTNIYSPILRDNLLKSLKSDEIEIKSGVLGFQMGPNLETNTDCTFYSSLGVSCLTMNIVSEATLCHQQGMNVFAFCYVSREASKDKSRTTSYREMILSSKKDPEKQKSMLKAIIKKLPKE